MISDIPMEDRDTKGDLYEYLLSKLSTAGANGPSWRFAHVSLQSRLIHSKSPEPV